MNNIQGFGFQINGAEANPNGPVGPQNSNRSLIEASPAFDQTQFSLIPGGASGEGCASSSNEAANLSQIGLALIGVFTAMVQFLLGTKVSPPQINLNNNAEIAENIETLVGDNPNVLNLIASSTNTDPESPQGQQLMQQLRHNMQQSGYPANTIKKVFILISALSINNIEASLQAIGNNLQPGSGEAQQIQTRLNALQEIKAALSQQLTQAG